MGFAAKQWILAIAVLLTLPTGALGQKGLASGTSDRDQGLWWSVSMGAAGTRFTCDLCQNDRDLGPSVEVAIGTYAESGFRVGVDGGAWTHLQGDLRQSIYRAGVTAQLHPKAGSGFYLTGGFGWSGYRAGTFRSDIPRLTMGAGWDLPLGSSWVVGNSVVLDAASYGSLKNGNIAVARSVGLSVVRFGVHLRHR
jgi:hypothetical protein